MDAGVFGEFGVEGCGHRSSLPDCYRDVMFAFGGDHFYAGSQVFDSGGADENHLEG